MVISARIHNPGGVLCAVVVTAFFGLGLPAAGQNRPEPIAKTRVGNRTLEIHAVVPVPPDLVPRINEPFLPFADRDAMGRLNQELGIEAWGGRTTNAPINDPFLAGGKTRILAIGMLLVNDDGTLPAEISQTCTAYRAQTDADSAAQYWPFGMQSPVQEVTRFTWAFDLTPLLITISSDVQEVKGLEGVLLSYPGSRGVFEFDKESLLGGMCGDDQLMVLGNGTGKGQRGMLVHLGLCSRNVPKLTSSPKPPQSALGQLATIVPPPSMNYLAIAGGRMLRPQTTANTILSSAQQQETLREVKKTMAAMIKRKEIDAEDAKFMLSGKDITFENVTMEFADLTGMERLLVQYTKPLGGLKAERFVFDNIPLESVGSAPEVNAWIKAIPKASASTDVKDAGSAMRVWQDASGKFRVEAKLIEKLSDAVRLEKSDGSQITVPLNRLSEQDVKYLSSR